MNEPPPPSGTPPYKGGEQIRICRAPDSYIEGIDKMSIFVLTKCTNMSKEVKLRIGRNLRYLRESKKLSPELLGDELGISSHGIYSYERGRTEPNAEMIIAICKYFSITADAFLLGDFARTNPSAMMKMGKNKILFPITIDKEGKENIQLVNAKASAGYTAGYNDPEYITALPSFQLPFLSGERTYRAFQLQGDSMHPIPDSTYVIGEYIEEWRSIKDGHAYIFVTRTEGIVFKIAYNQIRKKKNILLKSLNKAYKPYEISVDEILQVWKFVNYISDKLPEHAVDNEGVIKKLDELRKLVVAS